jgi:hypothetical protein
MCCFNPQRESTAREILYLSKLNPDFKGPCSPVLPDKELRPFSYWLSMTELPVLGHRQPLSSANRRRAAVSYPVEREEWCDGQWQSSGTMAMAMAMTMATAMAKYDGYGTMALLLGRGKWSWEGENSLRRYGCGYGYQGARRRVHGAGRSAKGAGRRAKEPEGVLRVLEGGLES